MLLALALYPVYTQIFSRFFHAQSSQNIVHAQFLPRTTFANTSKAPQGRTWAYTFEFLPQKTVSDILDMYSLNGIPLRHVHHGLAVPDRNVINQLTFLLLCPNKKCRTRIPFSRNKCPCLLSTSQKICLSEMHCYQR